MVGQTDKNCKLQDVFEYPFDRFKPPPQQSFKLTDRLNAVGILWLSMFLVLVSVSVVIPFSMCLDDI